MRARRAEIDALNVFPVPDADTGANVLATLHAADAALAEASAAADDIASDGVASSLRALADGAAQHALGNSGFIVSQLLRGFADAAEASIGAPFDGAALAAALVGGAGLAAAAVYTPADGTVLTVADAAGLAATQLVDAAAREPVEATASCVLARPVALAPVLLTAVRAADAALQRTTMQLPQLAQAGVVDAGGRAYVVLLDALVRVVTGEPAILQPVRLPLHTERPHPGTGFGFEVQYRIDAAADAMPALGAALAALGDSVAVVPAAAGRRGTWNVHAHVDDIGAAIEAGVEAGRPYAIAVTRLDTGAHDARPVLDAGPVLNAGPELDALRGAGPTVLAIAPGEGLAHLFAGAGVQVIEGSADAGPSVDEVVEAVRVSAAAELVLLPNTARITGVAEAVATRLRAEGMRVSVVPTRSPVQALAAVAVHDAARAFDDDVVAMAEAAAATRHAELLTADADALTAVGLCRAGDVLGLIDGDVVEIGRDLLAVALHVVDRLLGVGAELVTILVGATAPPNAGDIVARHVREHASLTDVAVYYGGRLQAPLIIGAE